MFRYALVCFGALFVSTIAHLTDEQQAEFHKLIKPIVEHCLSELEISMDDYETMKESHDPSKIDSCFFRCVFKANGIIDENGLFDKESSLKMTEEIVKNEEDLANIRKVAEICFAVNKEETSDGDKGCERAKLLAECFHSHKSELGHA